MAITITAVPAARLHTLSDNPVLYYFSSTNSNQTNFSLIVKVYVNGSEYSTHQIFPRPDGSMLFDASGITRAVSSIIPRSTIASTVIPSQPFVTFPQSPTTIYVTAQERYGEIPELQGSVVTSNTVRCWKGRLKEQHFTTFNGLLSRYQSEQPTRGKMLTDFPRNEKRLVAIDEPFYLGAYVRNPQDTSTGFNRYRLTFFNAAGGVVATKNIAFESTIDDNGLVQPNLGLDYLVSLSVITQSEANLTSYYRIGMQYIVVSVSQTALGEFMDVYPFRGCNFGQTVYFMNRYGMIDSFLFWKRTISRTEVKGATAETYNDTLAVQTDGEYEYIRIAENKIRLKTDWLTQGVYNWLRRELIESPYILTEIDGVLSRCKVVTSQTQQRLHDLDIMFDFEVELQVSLKDTSAVI